MSIDLRRDFSVVPKVLSAGGNALDSLGLIITKSDLLPAKTVQSFVNADAVGLFFGTSSDEYKAAKIYFNGADNANGLPSQLFMRRFIDDQAGAAGWTRSATFGKKKIDDIKTLTGTIIATIDGTSATSQSINLSTATSFDSAATLIETAMGAKVTVTWNAILKAFIITSKTKGATSQVKITGGTISDGLLLTKAAGAIESSGSAVETVDDMMNGIISMNQLWVAFSTIFDCDKTLSASFAAWANSKKNRYAYSMHDSPSAILSNQSADCNMIDIIDYGYENVIPTFGTFEYAVLPLAYLASINFNFVNGRAPLKFRSFSGIEPNVTDTQSAANAEANNYNYYGSYAANATKATYYAQGFITGKFSWVDSWINNVWLNASIIGAFANYFTTYGSTPFNDDGYTAVKACVIDPAEKAKRFGAIRTGVTLSAQQKQVVLQQTGGKDITQSLYSDGYFQFIPEQDAISRAARKLSSYILFYCDGQSIQSIEMVSEEIE